MLYEVITTYAGHHVVNHYQNRKPALYILQGNFCRFTANRSETVVFQDPDDALTKILIVIYYKDMFICHQQSLEKIELQPRLPLHCSLV